MSRNNHNVKRIEKAEQPRFVLYPKTMFECIVGWATQLSKKGSQNFEIIVYSC